MTEQTKHIDEILQRAEDVLLKEQEGDQAQRRAVDPQKALEGTVRIRKGEDPLSSRPYMYSRALRGLLFDDWSLSKVELEAHRELEERYGPVSAPGRIYVPLFTRAMEEGTDTAGGYLVSPEQAAEIIELLRDETVVLRAGAQQRTLPRSGQLDIPRRTGKATAYWLGEGSSITASDLSYGILQLRAKKLAAFVIVSNELIRDAVPSVERDIRQDLVLSFAEAEDFAFLEGPTATPQNNPIGIINASGTTGYTLLNDAGSGATPSFDDLINMTLKFQEAKGNLGNRGVAWIMHPRTLNTLLKLKDADNRYLFQPDLTQKTSGMILGLPVYLSTQISVDLTKGTSTDCSYIILGDFSQAIVARHEVLEIEVDRSFLFQNDQTAIRAIQRLDFGLRQPSLFVIADGVRP